jgi:uncharacterized UBP type Zn finger protein
MFELQSASQHVKSSASLLDSLKKWSWEILFSERIQLAKDLLVDVTTILDKINKLSEPYLNESRQDVIVNKSTIYKKARIVGYTVTSASRRLAAIQACEPFAIVLSFGGHVNIHSSF